MPLRLRRADYDAWRARRDGEKFDDMVRFAQAVAWGRPTRGVAAGTADRADA